MIDPIRALADAIRNLDSRLRRVETREALAPTITNATLAGAWTNSGGGYPVASYYKDATNTVWLSGRVTGGAVPSTIFTLPVGNRPAATISIATSLGDVIEVASTGVVTVVSGASPVSLDGVAFRAYS